MDTDTLAKLRAIADASDWEDYLDAFTPDVVKALLDVIEAARLVRAPIDPEVPAWAFQLNAALAALAEKVKSD